MPFKPRGEGCLFILIDHISFEPLQSLDEPDAFAPHCKRRGRKSVGIENVGPYNRQAQYIGGGLDLHFSDCRYARREYTFPR